MDGTLIDSSEDILNNIKIAYELSKIDYNKTILQTNLIGPPIKEIIIKISPLLTEEENNLIINNFRQVYDYCDFEQTYCYKGVKELLLMLKSLAKKIFITTNKPLIPTQKILKKFEIDLFDDVITVDYFSGEKISKHKMIEILIEKWNLDRDQTVIIGDSLSDIEAGIASKIKTVAALYGYEAGLEKLSDNYIHSIQELQGLYCD